MATYTHNGLAGSPGSAWYDSIGNIYKSSGTSLITITNGDFQTRLIGTFAVNGLGVVTGGTITAMQRTSLDGGTVYETIIGIASMPVLSFLGAPNSLAKMGLVMAGVDTLNGHGGIDYLRGFGNNDTLNGGLGDDVYTIESAGDVINEAAGGGLDLVETKLASYTLGTTLEYLRYTGSGGFNGTGNGADNILIGGVNGDTLTGLNGNDVLNGKEGGDTMIGGIGNDVYWVDDIADVIVDSDGETDTVRNYLDDYTMAAGIENYEHFGSAAANVTGNGNKNYLGGSVFDDEFFGLGGNDTFSATPGEDTAHGGLGDDNFYINSAGDLAVEADGEGDEDTVWLDQLTVYAMTEHVENLYALNGAAFTIIGNDADNVVIFASGDDVVFTGDGADLVNGNDGNDQLSGGADIDVLNGAGDDDRLTGGAGADQLHGDAGTDSAEYWESAAAVQVDLAAAVQAGGDAQGDELFDIENLAGSIHADTLTGNGGANVLSGGGGNDILDGGLGTDTMQGGFGGDTYFVNSGADIVDELAGDGIDTISSIQTYSLTWAKGDLERLTLTGNGNINANGNELGNILTGNGGLNTLTGNGGKDTLNGGLGADIMTGGKGDDTYYLDDIKDVVTESAAAGGGLDVVYSAITASLSDALMFAGPVEHLALTGTALNATGNGLANNLVGNDLGNTLSGLDNDDRLIGGKGIDVLFGGVGVDALTGGEGNDRLQYKLASESTSAARDTVTDFDAAGNDRLDFAALVNGALQYVGAAAFNGTGQVRINDIAGPHLLVEVNLTGDVTPEMVIRLATTNFADMGADDFIL